MSDVRDLDEATRPVAAPAVPAATDAMDAMDAPAVPAAGDAPAAPTGGLRVRDVVVRYEPVTGRGPGTTAVDGVSLDVAPGEVLALLGPSGCGKSSLLRAVAGIEPVAAGTVAWDGQDLAGVPVHRRGFGLMFQDGQLFPHRDVARNVAYGLETAGVPRAARAARVAELLDLVGLAGYGRRPVASLSGGEKQRVALARSLAPRPRLLLLDEPLSALDRGLRERLAADLREALRATGTTGVFVTHDHDEAFTVADRVAVMDAGHLLQAAPPEELWRRPASRRVAGLLGFQAVVRDDDGALLAVGPRGLRARPGALPGEGTGAGWPGTVVGSVFRRGATEVTVDVALPDPDEPDEPGPAPVRRVAALLAGGAGVEPGPVAAAPGDVVRVVVDRSGCAVLPG